MVSCSCSLPRPKDLVILYRHTGTDIETDITDHLRYPSTRKHRHPRGDIQGHTYHAAPYRVGRGGDPGVLGRLPARLVAGNLGCSFPWVNICFHARTLVLHLISLRSRAGFGRRTPAYVLAPVVRIQAFLFPSPLFTYWASPVRGESHGSNQTTAAPASQSPCDDMIDNV